MSIKLLRERGDVLGEHSTTLDFPITYVVHLRTASEENPDGFTVSIYHERFLRGALKGHRDGNSDIAFATWTPSKGLGPVGFSPYHALEAANLMPEINEFCERAYQSWKDGQEDDDED